MPKKPTAKEQGAGANEKGGRERPPKRAVKERSQGWERQGERRETRPRGRAKTNTKCKREMEIWRRAVSGDEIIS